MHLIKNSHINCKHDEELANVEYTFQVLPYCAFVHLEKLCALYMLSV